CFSERKVTGECLVQVFRKTRAVLELRTAMEKTFGAEAWTAFQQEAGKPSRQPKLVPDVVPTDESWWKSLEIRLDGEKAAFYNPVTEATNVLAHIDGRWLIETSSTFDREMDMAKLAEYLKRTTDAINSVKSDVENRRITASEVGSELFRRTSKR